MANNLWYCLNEIIKRFGGNPENVGLSMYMEDLNHSLVFCPEGELTWLGVKIKKTPLDAFIFQEIITEKRPDTIIETGTANGGSAYFFATLFDLLKIDGKIITIDIKEEGARPQHPKIEYILSDCLLTDIKPIGKTMVVLDCNHKADHVYQEMLKFSPMVTSGQYLVVEDTDFSQRRGRGPKHAINQFLQNNDDFVNDKTREKLCLSSNLGGWLIRK